MAYSAHVDSFARDRLPPKELWPELLFELPELTYPERLNCATELLDKQVFSGDAERPVLHASIDGRRYSCSYRELLERANRIANVLVNDLGLEPGNRVLLRSPNNPMLAACLFAVLKAGGIIVPTMPLLRARELGQVIEKAKVRLALCDARLRDEMQAAAASAKDLERVVYFDDLEARAERRSAAFANVETAAEDIAMIAFTSGTTGTPKAAAHFHRDVMAMCDAWPRSILQPDESDVFCGTPPLAFTYGLGIMLCIPMRFGASTVLTERPAPAALLQAIHDFRCTVMATAPTFYRQIVPLAGRYDLRSLRKAVSSGEALADATRQLFREATGIELIDGLGCTEMMQTFLSHTPERARRGATGYVIPGYRAEVLDTDGKPCPPGVVGRLAVKGASGCLYLADERQASRVQGGWYITGDAFARDEDGYFYFHGRTDELIVSAGYNISPLDVESALLEHEAVAECGVTGVPDAQRGRVVCAFVVLKPGYSPGEAMSRALQQFVKDAIAPYKYPRRIEFVEKLPRTETGKLQRFKLGANMSEQENITYRDPACAYCPASVRACSEGEAEKRGPGFCPSKVDPGTQERAHALYANPETRQISRVAALVESTGYCKWTRVEEVVEFSKRMGYKKIGIANCIAFVDLAYVLSGILESHGFEVVSVACKNGNIPKEELGIADHEKVRPGQFEALCNPVSQAELLNAHGCEFNVLMGLCIGHDSLFFKYASAPTTVLVTKDRVLGHNPIAALQLADSYYRRVWGPDKPAKKPKLPVAGRRMG